MTPTKVMQERIFIRTNHRGYIPQLRMQGPIITPIPVTRADAHKLIVAGIDVYQIDPVTKMATKLDLQSVFPGEGDPVKKEETATSVTSTPNVSSEPVKPVTLQGVTTPIKEENGIKVDPTPVDPKTAEAEEIKPETKETSGPVFATPDKTEAKAEETQAAAEATTEETATADSEADEKEETATPDADATATEENSNSNNNNQQNQNNYNGKNKNKN